MLNSNRLAFLIAFFVVCQTAYSQLGFSHEIGVIAGPLQFKSDFGQRSDSKTNFGNIGIGIGIVHYINFAYRADCNCYTTDNYFNDHFKIRNEISWNRTKLEHFGRWVEESRTSLDAQRLRAHTGVAKNLDIGTQLEFFPRSIRRFQAYGYKISPYASLGIHYTSFSPEANTTFGDGLVSTSSNFYSGWAPGSIDPSSGSAWSVVSSLGFRYKVARFSDVVVDLRWQYYFSDWVDGLNHNLSSSRTNDWLLWLNFGYVYYLN